MRFKAHVPYQGIIVPNYVDQDLWDIFMAQRMADKRGKVFSQNAAELLLKDLIKIKCAGYDPNESLRYSIKKGYDGLFPHEEQQIQAKPSTQTNAWLREYESHKQASQGESAHEARRRCMALVKRG